MRIAVFGGTFDPPHVGHLLAAQDAFDQLDLHRLIFVPAATQPLKTGRTTTPAALRLEMVRSMVGSDPRFEVSTVEIDRAGLSFTVDTLNHFASVYPDADRYLLVGADVLTTFAQWREPTRVLQLARLVVLERQGDEALRELPPLLRDAKRLPTRRVDVSATEIRERVRLGKPVLGFVTDGVAALIGRSGIYREGV